MFTLKSFTTLLVPLLKFLNPCVRTKRQNRLCLVLKVQGCVGKFLPFYWNYADVPYGHCCLAGDRSELPYFKPNSPILPSGNLCREDVDPVQESDSGFLDVLFRFDIVVSKEKKR